MNTTLLCFKKHFGATITVMTLATYQLINRDKHDMFDNNFNNAITVLRLEIKLRKSLQ